MRGIIYKLTSPKGKIYIGQTILEFDRRLSGHKCDSKRYNSHMNKAIRKYGIDAFEKEVLLTIDTNETNIFNHLDALEIYFIKSYDSFNNGYNGNTGGRKNFKISEEVRSYFIGRTVTEETKEKLRQINTGKKLSDATKLKISIKGIGRVVSQETRDKIGLKHKGKKLSLAQIESIRNSNLGKKQSLETIEKRVSKLRGVKRDESAMKKLRIFSLKPVNQYSINGDFIREWECARDVSRELGYNYKNISATCSGNQKSHKGFKWAFKENTV
jgi:group I intron endonuclease